MSQCDVSCVFVRCEWALQLRMQLHNVMIVWSSGKRCSPFATLHVSRSKARIHLPQCTMEGILLPQHCCRARSARTDHHRGPSQAESFAVVVMLAFFSGIGMSGWMSVSGDYL